MNFTRGWYRLRHRLYRIIHSKQPPEHIARGAGIGTFLALTPTVGVQVAMISGLWLVLRKRWPFNLPLAIACTLISNVLTIPPIFYVFIVTGRVMLGRFDELRGFGVFIARLEDAISTGAGFWQSIWLSLVNVFDEFGVPLVLGSLPWSIGIGVVAYFVALRIVERRRAHREQARRRPWRDV